MTNETAACAQGSSTQTQTFNTNFLFFLDYNLATALTYLTSHYDLISAILMECLKIHVDKNVYSLS